MNIKLVKLTSEYKNQLFEMMNEWTSAKEKGYLIETCLTAQIRFKKYLGYFRIP